MRRQHVRELARHRRSEPGGWESGSPHPEGTHGSAGHLERYQDLLTFIPADRQPFPRFLQELHAFESPGWDRGQVAEGVGSVGVECNDLGFPPAEVN